MPMCMASLHLLFTEDEIPWMKHSANQLPFFTLLGQSAITKPTAQLVSN